MSMISTHRQNQSKVQEAFRSHVSFYDFSLMSAGTASRRCGVMTTPAIGIIC
ncbi:hypothetical protein ACQKGL_26720 [Ensifer adhaerens]|uniref:hypothetical protein n=1 Tax=Ensifer adhaerens TaxID=106592 RepID=UPI003D050F4C